MAVIRPEDLPLRTAKEIAADLRITERAVREKAKDGVLPSVTINRRVLFVEALVLEAVAAAMERGEAL